MHRWWIPVLIVGLFVSAALMVSAQDIGPVPVIDNEHAALEPFTSVIRNPGLADDPTRISVNGRTLEVPPQWSFTSDPAIAGLPPFVRRWEEPGYAFVWDWIGGRAGFAQDGIQLYGNQRYAIRVAYATDLEYTSTDFPFTSSNVRVQARLYTAQSGITELPPQSMQGLAQAHTIEWVIESADNPYPFVRLEVVFDVEWPIFLGSTNLRSIDLVTAPADYKPQFVINFE